MAGPPEILAAGAVVMRRALAPGRDVEVLLVHRPRYDDWAFPKGKADPGEHLTETAVREVEEETGLRITLGPPLSSQRYDVVNGASRTKVVGYWVGRLTDHGDISRHSPNAEIDEVSWVLASAAPDVLSYTKDRATLIEALAARGRSAPLLVIRHGKAIGRGEWAGDDHARPLALRGEEQAARLVPILAAYGVRRLVTSSSARCWTTLAPYAAGVALPLEQTDALSEEGGRAKRVRRLLGDLTSGRLPTALCTHRPVLPMVLQELGLSAIELEPGALVVAHHRDGQVIAHEVHTE